MLLRFHETMRVMALMLPAAVAGCDDRDEAASRSTVTGESIRLTWVGATPKTIWTDRGETVTFVNDDTVDHQIASNRHPSHTDCPELNGPVLRPGDSFTATMTAAGSECRFHDDLDPTNPSFQGTVTVEEERDDDDFGPRKQPL